MKILICGSRNFIDEKPIAEVINKLPEETTVIVGGARGADKIAENLAFARGDLIVEIFYANWDTYGKSAGPKRNIEMLNQNPVHVYAFPLGNSVGTWHTIREAEKRKIPVTVYAGKQEKIELYLYGDLQPPIYLVKQISYTLSCNKYKISDNKVIFYTDKNPSYSAAGRLVPGDKGEYIKGYVGLISQLIEKTKSNTYSIRHVMDTGLVRDLEPCEL